MTKTDEEILAECLGSQRTLGDMLRLACKLAREDEQVQNERENSEKALETEGKK